MLIFKIFLGWLSPGIDQPISDRPGPLSLYQRVNCQACGHSFSLVPGAPKEGHFWVCPSCKMRVDRQGRVHPNSRQRA